MSRLEKLEREVESLDKAEFLAFVAWFEGLYWRDWDARIEDDVAAGRLDRLADEALNAHRSGQSLAF